MRFEIHGKMKSFIAGALCSLAFGLWACSGETETQVAAPDLSELFENVDDAEIDVESRSIVLPEGTSSFKEGRTSDFGLPGLARSSSRKSDVLSPKSIIRCHQRPLFLS